MPIRSLPILALSLPGLLAAQGFRLEDYEPAPYHRHFLSLAPGLYWQALGYRQDRDTLVRNSGNGYGSPSLDLAYGSRAWDPSREWKLEAALHLDGTGSDNRSHSETEPAALEPMSEGSRGVNGDRNSRASAGASYRKYLRRSWFLEPAGKGSVAYSPGRLSHGRSWSREAWPAGGDSAYFAYRSESSRRDYQLDEATLGFTVGHGRILDVGFASTGLFMLDRLASSGAPGVRLDAQGMHDLEAFVESRRKLRPFLDRRRAAIYDMASVEGFLRERGGAPIPAEALLAMADEWANPSPIPRERGWELRLYPFLRGSWRDERDRDNQKNWSGTRPEAEDEDASIAALTSGREPRSSMSRSRSFQGEREYGVAAGWELQRPWRRRFQFAATADYRYSHLWTELGSSNRYSQSGVPGPEYSAYLEQYTTALAGDVGASAAWIPDSRLWARASWAAHAAWKGNEPPDLELLSDDQSARFASTGLELKTGYEVAPRLAMQGTLSWNGSWSDGYLRELDYSGYRYRFDHQVDFNGTWHADLSLNYYLF